MGINPVALLCNIHTVKRSVIQKYFMKNLIGDSTESKKMHTVTLMISESKYIQTVTVSTTVVNGYCSRFNQVMIQVKYYRKRIVS